MRLALRLARRGFGTTSPNPMVGAVLVKRGKIIGRGWHRRAGEAHAEIAALRDAQQHGHHPRGATLYVTLEPCCTHGRTPPCTEAIKAAGINRVVVGAVDPNPGHAGKGFKILQRAGIEVGHGILADECACLNEAFNHWVVHRTPFVTVKAAMTLDGKIATASGESKWITGESARAHGMKLRQGSDAILVGINTVLAFVNAVFLGAGAKVWGYSNALWSGVIFAALILPVFAFRHYVQDRGHFPKEAMEDLGLTDHGDLGPRRAGFWPYAALIAGVVVVLWANWFFQLPG